MLRDKVVVMMWERFGNEVSGAEEEGGCALGWSGDIA